MTENVEIINEYLYDKYKDDASLILSLEDRILDFSRIIDDLQQVRDSNPNDSSSDLIDSLIRIYQMKYDILWAEFELVVRKFYELQNHKREEIKEKLNELKPKKKSLDKKNKSL